MREAKFGGVMSERRRGGGDCNAHRELITHLSVLLSRPSKLAHPQTARDLRTQGISWREFFSRTFNDCFSLVVAPTKLCKSFDLFLHSDGRKISSTFASEAIF